MSEHDDIPDRTRKLLARSEEEWAAIQDATATVIGFRAGRTLSDADVAALNLYLETEREDHDNAIEAYHQGTEDGRLEAGGSEVARLLEKLDAEEVNTATERAMRRFDEARGFVRGAQACREMLARFVEQGGDATTAASIRANWHPGWGDDPGQPPDVAGSFLSPRDHQQASAGASHG